jgi:NAD-dependent dihydropyrimidine dehydrogenase PreA subunit
LHITINIFVLKAVKIEKVQLHSAKKKNIKSRYLKTGAKRCGICVEFCPKSVLARDEYGSSGVKNRMPARASLCEIRCPDLPLR